jgi:hypothetical protein
VVSSKINFGERLRVTPHRAILDVPRELIWFMSRLLADHRRVLGTRKGRRSLTPYRQAVFGLAWFREKRNIPNLGRGFGLSQATSYNYINEIIGVLAAQAPDLHEALDRAKSDGCPHLILDVQCGHRPDNPVDEFVTAIAAQPRNRITRQRSSPRTKAQRRTERTRDFDYIITITASNLPKGQ